jgi:hypothetical protein
MSFNTQVNATTLLGVMLPEKVEVDEDMVVQEKKRGCV